MWFGTQDGLNRYDGANITVYKNNPIDSNSIAANNIICLFQDKAGTLWIGTEGGLTAFNTYTGRYTNYYHSSSHSSLTGSYVSSIYQDRAGTLWVGTIYSGLNKFNPKTRSFTRYYLSPSDTGASTVNYISSITEDSSGNLWMGSFGKGLFSFNKSSGAVKCYLQYNDDGKLLYPVGEDKVNTICYLHRREELLLGTLGNGLEVFNLRERKFVKYYINADTNHASYPRLIKGITADSYGNIWIAAGRNEGVYKFRPDEGRFESHKSALTQNNNNGCNCITVSDDGIIWAGTNNGVIYYISTKRNFVNYRDTTDKNSNVVMSLAREDEGRLWIGTDGGGLISFDENTKTYNYDKTLNAAINNKSILSLCLDKRAILWIGSWGAGALGYNLISGHIIKLDSIDKDLEQATVTCITQDHAGKIWLGTYGKGAFIYDGKSETIESMNSVNGLSDNRIYCLYEDRNHTMWIGTDGGGVNCYNLNDGKNTVIKKTSGNNVLSSNSVDCIYEDAAGNVWIGTGAGLNKYVPGNHRFIHYFQKDGLPNDYIYNIMPDRDGNLWISTNKGLSKFNPNVPNEAGSAFRNYDESDGVGENEFNQGACLKTNDGRMIFGGMNGLVSFYPEKVVGNTHIPSVYITSCELFGKEYQMDTLTTAKKYLELSWKNNTLSFSFVGLNYEIPSKNRYSYMMEGVDKDWSPPSTRHFASYAQLPPGDYVLRVRASNNDGVWNNNGAALYIRIVPPFWRTNWFYATCIILILVSFFGFVRYRTNRIQKEKKILEAKVEERTRELAQRTQELAQKNRDITSSIEYARRIQQAMLPPIEDIKKSLPDSFVLYMPKDIVSGDFYWYGEKDNRIIIVAADCTGHGVPGALMSMIGHNLLNQIVLEQGLTQPSAILNQLNTMVQIALKQGISNIDTTDGMDLALCSIDITARELQFAGANRPLMVINGDKITKIEPDKKPIGGSQIGLSRDFKNNTYKIAANDRIYMFSDGYADQFGGENGKKYMLKRFMDKLAEIHTQPMISQESELSANIIAWRGNNEQVDDILVIGMHFS